MDKTTGMRKVMMKIGLVWILMSYKANAQKSMMTWCPDVIESSRRTEPAEQKKTKKEYLFTSYKQKEEVLKAAYERLNQKLNDANCPLEIIEKEKKEFVSLMKGKIEEGDS
jgi:hypothetical protein